MTDLETGQLPESLRTCAFSSRAEQHARLTASAMAGQLRAPLRAAFPLPLLDQTFDQEMRARLARIEHAVSR